MSSSRAGSHDFNSHQAPQQGQSLMCLHATINKHHEARDHRRNTHDPGKSAPNKSSHRNILTASNVHFGLFERPAQKTAPGQQVAPEREFQGVDRPFDPRSAGDGTCIGTDSFTALSKG